MRNGDSVQVYTGVLSLKMLAFQIGKQSFYNIISKAKKEDDEVSSSFAKYYFVSAN